MNRAEFMRELEALLQDVSREERAEALQYYNDYFDDAGVENEQTIIQELGSPKKVAEEVKAGLKSEGESPTYYEAPLRQPQRTSLGWKLLLIILIILVGAPVLLPLGIGLVLLVLGVLMGLAGLFAGIFLGAAALAVAGISLAVMGVILLVPEMAAGLFLIGTGLILTTIGVVLTVAAARVCIIVVPGMFRGIIELCRKPFHRRKAVA